MLRAAYELERSPAVTSLTSGVLAGRVEATTPHQLPVDWSPLPPGVSDVEVHEASMFVSPDAAEVSLPAVTVSPGDGGTFVLTLPAGLRVRALVLSDLTIGAGDALASLTSQVDLTSRDPALRLTVAMPDPRGGFAAPTFAVPPVFGTAGVTPSSLTGATFDGRVLTLPEPAASKLRIALVTGDPGEFSAAPGVSLSKVSALAARYPTGLALTADDGARLWEFPQELPPHSSAQPVDIKPGLKKALLDRVHASTAPSVTLTLDASAPSAVLLSALRIRGALVRTFPGTVRTVVAGAATPLGLVPAGAPRLFVDATTTITADVTVKYDGIRVVPELSDPAPHGSTTGLIVGAEGARVALPPAAAVLKTFPLARVGIIGRAPEACELSVRLVHPMSGEPLAGEPAVVQLEPSASVSIIWLPLASPPGSGGIAVAARVTRGRFFWATDPQGKPLVQVAVTDPEPPDQTVRLGGRTLATALAPAHRPAAVITAAFAGDEPPQFESTMFVTVDLSDVTVRYAR